jgi:hypothetical protein
MTKFLIILLAMIFFTSCVGSKNATQRNDNAYIVIPIQDHYSINSFDYTQSWIDFNAAKLTAW